MTIGELIKTSRLKAGHSQDYLADRLGVSRQTISNWENERTIPAADYLKKVSELYQISFDQMLGISSPPPVKRKLLIKYGELFLLSFLLLTLAVESWRALAYLFFVVVFLMFLWDISIFIRKKVALWKDGKKVL